MHMCKGGRICSLDVRSMVLETVWERDSLVFIVIPQGQVLRCFSKHGLILAAINYLSVEVPHHVGPGALLILPEKNGDDRVNLDLKIKKSGCQDWVAFGDWT